MGENHRPNIPDPDTTRGCRTELTRINSHSSAITANTSKQPALHSGNAKLVISVSFFFSSISFLTFTLNFSDISQKINIIIIFFVMCIREFNPFVWLFEIICWIIQFCFAWHWVFLFFTEKKGFDIYLFLKGLWENEYYKKRKWEKSEMISLLFFFFLCLNSI